LDLLPLLRAAQDGDEAAERELFRALSVRFRLIAYRMVRDHAAAEDVAQDAVIDVLNAYRSLDVKESFAAWARVVVRNRALKHLESRKKQAEVSTNLDEHDAQVVGADSRIHLRELQERLLICLDRLANVDIRYSRIINLKHLGYSLTEICKKLEVTANHAYVILHRARQSLQKCLGDGWEAA